MTPPHSIPHDIVLHLRRRQHLSNAGLEMNAVALVAVAKDHVVHMMRYLRLAAFVAKSATVASKLGTGVCGEGKITMSVLARRLVWLRNKVRRSQAMRRAGVAAAHMVRVACAPAVTYGVGLVGMSDSHLKSTRVAIAVATAPAHGGESPDLVLLALDTWGGTLDPAFDAICLPIHHSVTARWEGWTAPADWAMALLTQARTPMAVTTPICHKARGPVAVPTPSR